MKGAGQAALTLAEPCGALNLIAPWPFLLAAGAGMAQGYPQLPTCCASPSVGARCVSLIALGA